MIRRAPLVLLAVAFVFPGCASTLLDSPDKVRHDTWIAPPLYMASASDDGTSYSWDALFWLVGQDVESSRRHTRALPFYWRDEAPPYRESTLWFPLYYSADSAVGRTRFYSLLYGFNETDDVRTDYVLPPIFYRQTSATRDAWRHGLFLVYDWRHEEARNDFNFVSLLGLATLFNLQTGFPPDGETVGALGRESSRRFEVANVLNLVSLFGYDDVGDRREIRFGTFFGSETLSLFRSWRPRGGDDPFVREWLFPLYMNVADTDGGFAYVGPLWGSFDDTAEARHTDWWLLGLVSRTAAADATTWRVLGIPVSRSDASDA